MSLLGKLGHGLGIPNPESANRIDMEDGQPRHTMFDPVDPPLDDGFPGSRDRTFGSLVMRTLCEQPYSPLRYSQRLELLKEAGQRGIGRFEANLIIASVQHRLKSHAPATPARKPFRIPGMLAYVFMQTMILWGAWRATRG